MKPHCSVPVRLATGLVAAALVVAPSPRPAVAAPPASHFEVANQVAGMVGDPTAQRAARRHGLDVVNVMWEDTGRYLGSSVGPNISDVTIEVEAGAGGRRMQRFLMPVLRYPNFTDKTGDIDIDKLMVRVGNHAPGQALRTISLRELLARPAAYLSLPNKGTIKGGTLLAQRDELVLTSAQAAFLPIRKNGVTRFWPVIFNYQSYAQNPAVLTILVTRQGTSTTIIDNQRDSVGGSWGQRLYFNDHGQRAPLIAERAKDVQARGVTANGEAASSLGEDANLMMIIQVPLKVRERASMWMAEGSVADDAVGGLGGGTGSGYGKGAPAAAPTRRRSVDVDRAVIGHGPSEGRFTELDGLTIERDPRFPVRVTVQFYQATSNGAIDSDTVAKLAANIERVYKEAEFVGSLVIPHGQRRPTLWDGASFAPANLRWTDFPGLVARFGALGLRALPYGYERLTEVSRPKLYQP